MSEPLEEIALARLAYEQWRAGFGPGLLAPWEGATVISQDWWYNRVGVFLEMPWQASAKETPAEQAIREVCSKHGGLDADGPPIAAAEILAATDRRRGRE